jgi:hypothetical protein
LLVSQFGQGSAQLLGKVHAALFPTLWLSELSVHPISSNVDEAIPAIRFSAKLYIAPFQREPRPGAFASGEGQE